MKKIIVLIATITYIQYAQNGQQIGNFTALVKVCGILKHCRPTAAKGKRDWDKELIRMIAPAAIKEDTIERIFDETDISYFGISGCIAGEPDLLYFNWDIINPFTIIRQML